MKTYEQKFDEALGASLEAAESIARGEDGGERVVLWVPPEVDVAAIRAGQGLTQEQFAQKWGLSLSAIKKWEGGHRTPEGPIRTLLWLISREPETIDSILRGTKPAGRKKAQPSTMEVVVDGQVHRFTGRRMAVKHQGLEVKMAAGR